MATLSQRSAKRYVEMSDTPAPLETYSEVTVSAGGALAEPGPSNGAVVVGAAGVCVPSAGVGSSGVSGGVGVGGVVPGISGGGGGSGAPESGSRSFSRRGDAASCSFESKDYDSDRSAFARRLQARQSAADRSYHAALKWSLSVAIGLTMGLLAFIVDALINVLTRAKFSAVLAMLSRGGAVMGATRGAALVGPYFLFIFISGAFALVAALSATYGEPLAAGSGIPELKCYLNGVRLPRLLRLRTLVCKLGGIIFTIAAGIVAGKEGPFVHAGGLVGGGLSQFALSAATTASTHGIDFGVREFRSDASKRDFVAIGTATGVAVAFGAPVGGMLFTLEEGASYYSTQILMRSFLSTCVGVITLHTLLQVGHDAAALSRTHFGTHRDFGLYDDREANYGINLWWYIWELPIFALLGAAGGLLGALFVRANVRLTRWRHVHVPASSPALRIAEVVIISVVTVTICYAVTMLSPCAPVPPAAAMSGVAPLIHDYEEFSSRQIEEDFFRRLNCPAGRYNVGGQLFFTPLSEALKLMLHLGEAMLTGTYRFAIGAVVIFLIAFYALMTGTYGIAVPSGLFVPSLAVGAALGQVAGLAVEGILASFGSDIKVDLHSYAIVGAAAMLGGATRMTISITVLVTETTGALQMLVPLMVTIYVAKVVADVFGPGIYDAHIHLRGVPFLDEEFKGEVSASVSASASSTSLPAGASVTDMRVDDVMRESPRTIRAVARVRDVVETITETDAVRDAHIFVTDVASTSLSSAVSMPVAAAPASDGEVVCGVIARARLIKMLAHAIGFIDGQDAVYTLPTRRAELEQIQDALSSVPTKADDRDIAHLKDDATGFVDLRCFMQTDFCSVQAGARLARAYELYRAVGLPYVAVTPPVTKVLGVIWRHELLAASSSSKLAPPPRGGTGAGALAAAQRRGHEEKKGNAGTQEWNTYDLPFQPPSTAAPGPQQERLQ